MKWLNGLGQKIATRRLCETAGGYFFVASATAGDGIVFLASAAAKALNAFDRTGSYRVFNILTARS